MAHRRKGALYWEKAAAQGGYPAGYYFYKASSPTTATIMASVHKAGKRWRLKLWQPSQRSGGTFGSLTEAKAAARTAEKKKQAARRPVKKTTKRNASCAKPGPALRNVATTFRRFRYSDGKTGRITVNYHAVPGEYVAWVRRKGKETERTNKTSGEAAANAVIKAVGGTAIGRRNASPPAGFKGAGITTAAVTRNFWKLDEELI